MISNLKILIVISWASLRLIIWDDAMNVRNVWFTVCFNAFNVKQKYLFMYVTKKTFNLELYKEAIQHHEDQE